MKVAYYPGCTLKFTAQNFEGSLLAVSTALGIELVELPKWYCCGTVFSLATDDLIHQLAPVRNLIRVKEQGMDKVVALCSMCYNTLKRVSRMIGGDQEKREKINLFMYEEETDYEGYEVEVVHLLELLRDEISFENLAQQVKRPLEGLTLAPYYGCLLLRPAEVGIDDAEGPTILEDLLRSLGAEVIDYPFKTECCGSYQTMNEVDFVVERAHRIISSATKRGAEALVTSCPLCFFNLDRRQKEVKGKSPDFHQIPIFYFTQLMALALGLEEAICRFEMHYVDPKPLLTSKAVETSV